jgi:preprotein translocase subunit SecG
MLETGGCETTAARPDPAQPFHSRGVSPILFVRAGVVLRPGERGWNRPVRRGPGCVPAAWRIAVVATLAELQWPVWAVGVGALLFFVVCLLMVLTVLIQKPQGGGLSGAFGAGSGGSGQTAFGTKTGDVLTIFTVVVFVLFASIGAVLTIGSRPLTADQLRDREEAAAERAMQEALKNPPASTSTPTVVPGSDPAPGTTPTPESTTPGTTPASVNPAGATPPSGTPETTPSAPATTPATPETAPAPAPQPSTPPTDPKR